MESIKATAQMKGKSLITVGILLSFKRLSPDEVHAQAASDERRKITAPAEDISHPDIPVENRNICMIDNKNSDCIGIATTEG